MAASSATQFLSTPTFPHRPSPIPRTFTPSLPRLQKHATSSSLIPSASKNQQNKTTSKQPQKQEELEEEVEEELPWIQEKALDLVEFTGSVTQAIPGPRVARTQLPWAAAIPLAYVGFTFVFALVKTVRKFTSPREARRKLSVWQILLTRTVLLDLNYRNTKAQLNKVNKNAELCKSIDELFEKGTDGVDQSTLKELVQKTGFSMEDILRKYIRYALNEKPFNLEFVVNLIQLRKASSLNDSEVAEIVNYISRRIVKEKGPVVMDMSGYSEKGFKRKIAVHALFGKLYYLSELPEFCARDNSLVVKEIFGVTDEDAEKIRLHTISEAGDVDSLEKLFKDSESEDSDDGS